MRDKVDTLTLFVTILIIGLGLLIGLGSVASFIGWFRVEHRTQEAHGLAIAGETAAQRRADEVHLTFLEGSRNTLDLVNATLSLAKEASERAAKFIETKARETLHELDQQARYLISQIPSHDERALVADPALRSSLRSLAQRIAGFEINRFVLQSELQLTSACLFIRGLDFHLSQQFDDAFICWHSVALSSDRSTELLQTFAWYWIGYEQNNLGMFPKAVQSFESALDIASGPWQFELHRMQIESRFFAGEPYESVASSLEDLLRAADSESGNGELHKRRTRILTTMGNVYQQWGNSLAASGDAQGSREKLARAKAVYQEASGEDKWARLGFAEVLAELGDTLTAEPLFRRARQEAIEEYIRREEPRTKVLARTTELICCACVAAFQARVPEIYGQVIEALGRVDQRLTVYSQFRKRNVPKTDFQDELLSFMTKWEEEQPNAEPTG